MAIAYIMEYSEEVVRSSGAGVRTGVHGNKAVCPEAGVVCIEVRL